MKLTIDDLPEVRTLDRRAMGAVRGGVSTQAIDQTMPVEADGGTGAPASPQSSNTYTQKASNVSYASSFSPLGLGGLGLPGLFPMLGNPFGYLPG